MKRDRILRFSRHDDPVVRGGHQLGGQGGEFLLHQRVTVERVDLQAVAVHLTEPRQCFHHLGTVPPHTDDHRRNMLCSVSGLPRAAENAVRALVEDTVDERLHLVDAAHPNLALVDLGEQQRALDTRRKDVQVRLQTSTITLNEFKGLIEILRLVLTDGKEQQLLTRGMGAQFRNQHVVLKADRTELLGAVDKLVHRFPLAIKHVGKYECGALVVFLDIARERQRFFVQLRKDIRVAEKYT